jgi:hypothetical protein
MRKMRHAMCGILREEDEETKRQKEKKIVRFKTLKYDTLNSKFW